MKPVIRPLLVVAGLIALPGCPPAARPERVDIVFSVSRMPSLPNGRPVVDIRPNGKPRPPGNGPSGSYFLMTRRNGTAYYTRWFYPDEIAPGLQRDLDIPTIGLKPGDRLTVAVENVNGQDPSDYVRLSNVVDVTRPEAEGR